MEEDIITDKVLFVSNNTGTSIWEIFIVVNGILQSCLLYSSTYFIIYKHDLDLFKRLRFFGENLIIAVLWALLVTVWSDYAAIMVASLIAINLLILFNSVSWNNIKRFIYMLSNSQTFDTKYLSNYKAMLQLCTAICILAVDFRIFPRRFAKVEVYGIGLMDTAVGAVIFSIALTSRQSRFTDSVKIFDIYKTLKDSILISSFGIFRVIFIKQTNYQEHVTEYGVHWNFFFTISVVKFMSTVFLVLFTKFNRQPFFLIFSVFSIMCYQYSLSYLGLFEIIQTGFHGDNSRENFIDANREGVFSCFGYMAIYFFGLFAGRQIFRKNLNAIDLMKWLLVWALISLACLSLSMHFVSPISRQMANMSYYFFQLTFNFCIVLGVLLNDVVASFLQTILLKQSKSLPADSIRYTTLFQAISRNQLLYFLLANVFTGSVNVSINTLSHGTLTSLCVIISYIFCVNGLIIAVGLISFEF